MRVALFGFLLVPSCLAAASNASEKFIQLAASNGGVVPLNSALYYELADPNREWSASIQLTALGSRFKCMPCKEFDPTFKQAAKAWSKVAPEHRNHHFFATLDFEAGEDVFRALQLQSAPVLYSFSAVKGPHASQRARPDPITYDFNSNGFELEGLIEQLSRTTPVRIPYKKPLPYNLMIMGAIMLGSVVLVAPFVYPLFLSRWTWAAVTIVTILIMVGGQMFVRIRGMPYAYPQKNGGLQWVQGGFQNQLGMEVHVVAATYALMSLTLIALNSLVPRVPTPGRQKAGVFLWSTVFIVAFSGLLALFRVKNGAYPFRLFF